MTSVGDLALLRQGTLETFIVHGGKGKDHAFATGPEAATFTRDPALFTYPLYATSIRDNYEAQTRPLENTLSSSFSRMMTQDSLNMASIRAPGARENKYGSSVVSFDHEGALLAVGGSTGIVKVYDFDETYAATHMRTNEGSERSIKPILAFDTRRDITSISWSHLRPDDIAVAYLFRPEIHIFDLTLIDEGSGPLGGTAEEPNKSLTVDGKGSSGHNVVLYWHECKVQTHANKPVVLHSEGIIAGSVSGYIRYWTTTLSNGASSNTKMCMWNLLADPHRSALTACSVVSLLVVYNNHSSSHSTASSLLLAATAQGVITLWDLSNMRPASFGSTAPEPSCVRRLEFTNHLLLFHNHTLVGAVFSESSHCHHCKSKNDKARHSCDLHRAWEDRLLLCDAHATPHVVPSAAAETAGQATSKTGASARGSSASPPHTPQQACIPSPLVLTLSSGDVALVDLNTESMLRQYKNTSSAAAYETSIASTSAINSRKLVAQNDPLKATVVSYEELRREMSLQQEITEIGGTVSRNVLPAIVPAWAPAGHYHLQRTSASTPDARSQLSAPAVVMVLPDYATAGSKAMALDVHTGAVGLVYPNAFNVNGLCSVSGKDSDPTTGIVRSNLRRCLDYCTTLPGQVMFAEQGSHEVTMTHDLQAYLCPEAAAQASYSKSHEVQFDWTPSPLFPGCTPIDPSLELMCDAGVPHDDVPYEQTVSANAIAGTSGHRIVLQKPYIGPSVVDGKPQVYIRTTLVPSGRTANAAAVTDDKQALRCTAALSVRHNITAIAAHPVYPVLVAGTRSDDIILLNPMGKRHPRDDVQEEYSGENTTLFTSESAGYDRRWGRLLPINEYSSTDSLHTTPAEVNELVDDVPPVEAPMEDSCPSDVFHTSEESPPSLPTQPPQPPHDAECDQRCEGALVSRSGSLDWTPQLPDDVIELADSDIDSVCDGDGLDEGNQDSVLPCLATFQQAQQGPVDTTALACGAGNGAAAPKRDLSSTFRKDVRVPSEEPVSKVSKYHFASIFASRAGARDGSTTSTFDSKGKSTTFPAFRSAAGALSTTNTSTGKRTEVSSVLPPQRNMLSNLLGKKNEPGVGNTASAPVAKQAHVLLSAQNVVRVATAADAPVVEKGSMAAGVQAVSNSVGAKKLTIVSKNKIAAAGKPSSSGALADISRFFVAKK